MSAARYFQHPTALVETDPKSIGTGTRIWAFAHVLRDVKIGRDCNLGDHTFLESGVKIGHRVTLKNGVAVWTGVTLGDDVFVGPNAVFTNDLFPRSPRFEGAHSRYQSTSQWLVKTQVKRGVSIGANATIRAGITLGEFAMIGAGAVVTRDVLPHALILGVPGRQKGWVCCCGEPLKLSDVAKPSTTQCSQCGNSYRLNPSGRLRRHLSRKPSTPR